MYFSERTNTCPLSMASNKPQNCQDDCMFKEKGKCLLVEYLKANKSQ